MKSFCRTSSRPAVRGQRRSRQRGGALLLVMWMSAALAAIALSVSVTVRTEADHTSTVADGLRARYLAAGSVDRMLAWMSWGPALQGRTPGWNPAMTRYYMSYGTGDVVVEMISEASKLNINDASPNDLTPVIAVVTGNPEQTSQIVAGIMARRRPAVGGPNLGQMLQPGSTFGLRNASFQEIEELLSVPGVTPEVFYGNYISDSDGRLYARGGLRDVLSVWGKRAPFDVNGASPALLEALGIPPDRVQAILNARPFRNMAQVQAIAGTTRGLGIDGISMWTVRANARLRHADGSPSDVVRSAAAVVKVWMEGTHPAAPVQVLRYYPDAWSEFAAKPQVTVMGGPQ